jgi:hypothetical protein
MIVRRSRYSKEEFTRFGDEIYESQIKPQVEDGNHGKIVTRSTSKPEILKGIRAKL